jgi:hypothetical protein
MSDAKFFMRKTPYTTEQLTVSNVVKQLTSAKVLNTAGAEDDGSSPARWAVTFPADAVQVELMDSNGIYYTLDGSTPSSTNGGRLSVMGDMIIVSGRTKIANLKMIRVGSDSVVNVTYYRD